MIPLTNHDFQWGRSEVVIIYPEDYGNHQKDWNIKSNPKIVMNYLLGGIIGGLQY